MNVNAANSLLKTLEEPRPNLHLILVSSRPSALPATILSRCQRLKLPAPERSTVIEWLGRQRPSADWPAALDALGGAALDALDADPAALKRLRDDTWQALREGLRGRLDVLRTADAWSRDELPLRLNCIESYLVQRILDGPETGGAYLQGSDLELNIGHALKLLDGVRDIRRQSTTTLNKALMVEQLLWRLAAPRRPGADG
jgi:DNA polymerase-3 subunit delta'